MRSRVIALSTICLLLFGMFYLLLPTSAAADTWNGSITGGFTGNFDPAQRSVSCMTYFSVGGNNRLYAGTENDNGCRVYRYDGGSNWTQVNTDGFGNSNNTRATSMISYNGNLYVGTRNTSTGCEVWRYDGSNWTSYMLFGYLDRNNVDVSAMAEYSGVLYAGTENDSASGGSGCQVLAFSGVRLIWAQINTSGFGFTNNRRVSSMTAFNGSLVAGTENTGTGCQLWQYNGSAWGAAETNGFGDVNNSAATAMIQYDHGLGNRLYVGTHNNPNGPGVRGCQLWEVFGSWSSLSINMISTAGFGDGSNNSISSMAVFNDSGDKLFMGTASDWSGSNGCQIWTYDGSALNMPVTAGFGDPLNQGALAAATSDPGGGGAL